jgi:hypothetical protein
LAFFGFLGLAGGTLQQRWLGVDQGTREMVGLARFPGFDTPMRTVSILGDQAGLVLLIALASYWFSDVAGGFVLGLAYLLMTLWLLESYRHRFVLSETVALVPAVAVEAPRHSEALLPN